MKVGFVSALGLLVTATVLAQDTPITIRAGRLLDESHASLRDDYAVSSLELDTLAGLARGEETLEVSYEPSVDLGSTEEEQAQLFLERLSSLRPREVALGQTQAGQPVGVAGVNWLTKNRDRPSEKRN